MDLALATLLKRKASAEITKLLQINNISYRWGFPVKLIILRNGTPIILSTVAEAKKALARWDIPTAPDNEESLQRRSPPHLPRKLQKEWQRV
ncbi:hypothetical protein XELAEV_18029429mg [Xenopus laevis]|uniref:Uncharacterized protein n=1 Tax=Xenopus laevis TaxID=8355 RepID=A0A974CTF1_XENLA|nr:hypothetical protein XELAEV_18029429mg [Xenopus laevis]